MSQKLLTLHKARFKNNNNDDDFSIRKFIQHLTDSVFFCFMLSSHTHLFIIPHSFAFHLDGDYDERKEGKWKVI
jgi:hypothetical protein